MTIREVTPLRPRAPSAYTDTAAVNDIHALITAGNPGDATLSDIAQILTRGPADDAGPRHRHQRHRDGPGLAGGLRAGRRHIGVHPPGPRRPGLLIEIYAKTDTERDGLTVTLDDSPLLLACEAGSEPA